MTGRPAGGKAARCGRGLPLGEGRFGWPRPADALKEKGDNMKRYFLSGIGTLALAMAMVATAYSQMAHRVEAKIPFEFAVSGKVLPDGAYVVTGDTAGCLTIRSLDGGNAVLALATAARSNVPRTEATMVFDRIGDHYFLTQIWEPGSDGGVQIPRSKMESEMINRTLARSPDGQHQAGPELVYVTGRLF